MTLNASAVMLNASILFPSYLHLFEIKLAPGMETVICERLGTNEWLCNNKTESGNFVILMTQQTYYVAIVCRLQFYFPLLFSSEVFLLFPFIAKQRLCEGAICLCGRFIRVMSSFHIID